MLVQMGLCWLNFLAKITFFYNSEASSKNRMMGKRIHQGKRQKHFKICIYEPRIRWLCFHFKGQQHSSCGKIYLSFKLV